MLVVSSGAVAASARARPLCLVRTWPLRRAPRSSRVHAVQSGSVLAPTWRYTMHAMPGGQTWRGADFGTALALLAVRERAVEPRPGCGGMLKVC